MRDLFREPLVPVELKDFDAVVFDPPRAGAEAQCARAGEVEGEDGGRGVVRAEDVRARRGDLDRGRVSAGEA